MMKTVLIEMEKTRSPYNGLGNFCRNLGNAISKQPQQLQPIFYVPKKQIGLFGNAQQYCITQKWHRIFSSFSPKADLWHITHQDSRYWPPNKKTPLIVTIHDLNFLHTGKQQRRIAAHSKHVQKLIQRATVITTISNFCKQEIEQHLSPNIPIEVIPNGVTLNLNQSSKPSFIQDQPFLLALGEVTHKKNFHVLIRLLAKLPDYHLYIVGQQQPSYTNKIRDLAKAMRVENRLIMPGPVSEAEKCWLYQHCSAFLFPSLAEGFGLPVIEAMRAGRPVFLSNRTALPEIGGKLAYYFENFDADHMYRVFTDGLQAFQADSSNPAAIQAWSAQFSWETSCAKYLQLYLKLL